MPAHHGHPSNLSRREIMRLGLGGLSALSISDLVRQRSHAEQATEQETAVILVWLPGGHSHLETYDPKPQATSDFRGPYQPIKTVVPGMELCELLPHHARGGSCDEPSQASAILVGNRGLFGSSDGHGFPGEGRGLQQCASWRRGHVNQRGPWAQRWRREGRRLEQRHCRSCCSDPHSFCP